MIVEDDTNTREMYSFILENDGYSILEASSGQEALDLLKTHRPDIAILDRVLDDMDGMALCKQIKADPEMSSMYVILISGIKKSANDKLSGLEVGADDYVLKPISRQELLARVQVAERLKTAELLLRTQQQYVSTLAESSSELIIVLDQEGYIHYASASR